MKIWVFPCGKQKKVSDWWYGCYKFMGDMEAFLHNCPDESVNGDVNNCEVWIKRMKHE